MQLMMMSAVFSMLGDLLTFPHQSCIVADVMLGTGASYHCCNIMLYVTVFLVTLTISEDSHLVCNLPIRKTKTVFKTCYHDGDIIIGGLFTINTRSKDEIFPEDPYTSILCFAASFKGHMDAMVFSFAIDNINKDPDILPNITLGYHIYDSCLDTRLAVKYAFQLLSSPDKVIPNYSCEKRAQLAGVIGDHHSSTTIPVAQILGLYGYTQRTLLERRNEWRLQHQMQGTALNCSAVSCTVRVVPSRHTGITRMPHVCHTDVPREHTDTRKRIFPVPNFPIIWTCETGLTMREISV
ncbi:unnamed protein product [Ranitomeya imitator]|uniref:Receptor ligand binding region domain-containing protein n=1 Tax=Ranitomeya imitator TaxID=111125 RepID=A0ABN9KY95_9NEOB|nr:unnamed protein product [Ranitomeya imitator]